MQTVHLSFFTIGYNPVEFQDFETVYVDDLIEAKKLITKYDVDVLIIELDKIQIAERLLFDYSFINNAKQKVLVVNLNDHISDILNLHNSIQFDQIVIANDESKFEYFFTSLQNAKMIRQQIQMEKLLSERTLKLRQIQNELELKVEKRSKFLKESRRKLFNTNYRVETYKRLLFEIFNLKSVEEIEDNLNKVLLNRLSLLWVKLIYLNNKSEIANNTYNELHYSRLEIPITDFDQEIGKIVFMRDRKNHFRKDELDFFYRVAEAVSLAVHRIFLFQESEKAHSQWMETFHSIPAPFVIIDSQFQVVQSNLNSSNHQSQKCYELIFQRNEKCLSCKVGTNFNLEKYEVYGQKLKLEPGADFHYVHLYHNIEEKIKFERRLLETARASEVGIIGSSIAHELNNPLAGMLTLTQINLIELDHSHQIYQDLKTIEHSLLQCKEIISNLLIFARDESNKPRLQFQLLDCINRTINMCQLLYGRSRNNYKIITKGNFNKIRVFGNLNLIAQALKYIIEYFIDQITNNLVWNSDFHHEISIELAESLLPQKFKIIISCESNNIQIPTNHLFLSLTIAGKIFQDEGITLDWERDSDCKLSANIYISRPI